MFFKFSVVVFLFVCFVLVCLLLLFAFLLLFFCCCYCYCLTTFCLHSPAIPDKTVVAMFAFGSEGLGSKAAELIPAVQALGGSLIAQVNKGDSYSFLARKGKSEVTVTVPATGSKRITGS